MRKPVFSLPAHAGPVDVEVTYFTPGGRQVMRMAGVDPAAYQGKYLVVKVGSAARPTPAVSP